MRNNTYELKVYVLLSSYVSSYYFAMFVVLSVGQGDSIRNILSSFSSKVGLLSISQLSKRKSPIFMLKVSLHSVEGRKISWSDD